MEKVLTLNMNIDLTTECFTFFRLAIALSSDKNIPWYIEHFNNYSLANYRWGNKYTMYYDNYEYFTHFDSVLDVKKVYLVNNIVTDIIEAINNNGYFMVNCDSYYIQGDQNYQKEHVSHELLIFGYNEEQQEFDFVSANINNVIWGKHKLSFENLKAAYESCMQIVKNTYTDYGWIQMRNFDLPTSIFYLKEYNRQPRLELFYEQISACLQGGESLRKEIDNGNPSYFPTRHGITVYKGIYEDFFGILEAQDTFPHDYGYAVYKLKFLTEVKESLFKKISYLDQSRLLPINKNLLIKADILCNTLKQGFLLMLKYAFTSDKNILAKAKTKYMEAELLDIQILSELKDTLQKSLCCELHS